MARPRADLCIREAQLGGTYQSAMLEEQVGNLDTARRAKVPAVRPVT
jgi:hypothetical protein